MLSFNKILISVGLIVASLFSSILIFGDRFKKPEVQNVTSQVTNPSSILVTGDDGLKILSVAFPEIPNIEDYKGKESELTIPLENYERITSLDLSNLEISEIPEVIVQNFTNLEELSLTIIQDKNSLENLMKNLVGSKIKKLILKGVNKPEMIFEKLKQLDLLEKLEISDFTLEEMGNDFPNLIQKLTHLKMTNCGLLESYFRIICSGSVSNLVSLNLENNNLKEFFSSGKEDVILPPKLQKLNLSNCSILSDCLDRITVPESLTEVDLSNNDFSGITKKALMSLFKAFANPETETPLTQMKFTFSNMKNINLRRCCIGSKNLIAALTNDSTSEDFIKGLFNIEGLKNLDISENHFLIHFNDFTECKSMTSLEKLNISNNDTFSKSFGNNQAPGFEPTSEIPNISFQKFLKFLGNFSTLKYLDISGIKFDNKLAVMPFENLKKSLEHLKMNQCDATANILTSFDIMENLKTLEASGNCFKYLNENSKLPDSLKEINLSNSSLNGNGLVSVLKCPKLEKLIANNNDFSKLKRIAFPENVNSLKSLNISGSRVTIEDLKLFTHHFELKELIADKNLFNTESTPDQKIFGKSSTSLEVLSLADCSLNSQIIQEINENLQKLSNFIIYDSKVKNEEIIEANFEKLKENCKQIKIIAKNPSGNIPTKKKGYFGIF